MLASITAAIPRALACPFADGTSILRVRGDCTPALTINLSERAMPGNQVAV